jgi:phosphoenolpyruvate---glycerone phosphotransferase subunit DhaM
VVGIVLVSHSSELASGLAALAGQVAGEDVCVIAAGGDPEGGLGTDGTLVEKAIGAAEQGDGVVVLGDLGSAILTARHVLEHLDRNGMVKLADAPFVEGAVAAAVSAASGLSLTEVVEAAEGSRGVRKL